MIRPEAACAPPVFILFFLSSSAEPQNYLVSAPNGSVELRSPSARKAGIQAAHSSVSPAPSGKTPHIPLQVITIGRFARVPSAQAPLSIIFSEGAIFFTATQILIIYFIP